MNFLADIHLHSRWSRATSRDLTPENLHMWSMLKGISVVGTADFTHPEWLAELKEKLVPAEDGLYRLHADRLDPVEEEVPPACRREVRFLLSVEISSIYKKNGRTRKVHNVLCLPSFDAVDKLNRRLGAIGNLKSDGRPILGLDSRDLLEISLEVCPEVLFIPAHIWTPHFAVLGASSGFDSLEECFEDLLPHIFALETGLSSDPPMNSRLSALDRYAIVSNSDAHSAPKLGREATCFDTDLSFPAIRDALRSRDPARFTGTIEFYPEEGKYHLDGHRKCGVCWTPPQTLAADGLCPECGRKLTIGVLHRVELLADRAASEPPPVKRPFQYLIPLVEVIGSCVGVGPKSKRVQGIYHALLQRLGPELDILRHVEPERIAQCGQPLVAEGVRRMREGRVTIAPGYDGEYGVIQVFTDDERRQLEGQGRLFDLSAHTVKRTRLAPADVEAAAVVERLATGEGHEGRVDRLLETAPKATQPTAGLDAEQQRAVEADGGPVAVIAGPGAGKTRTLTHRIAWLIDERGVEAERIAAVTFTQRAARQMRKRLDDLMGTRAEAVVVGTFHRLALELMTALTGDPAPTVVDETEALGLLRDVLDVAPSKPLRARAAQRHISRWKADGLRPLQVAADPLALVYAGYEERLRVCGARDYDDLLLDLVERLRADAEMRQRAATRFAHLLVDEFQDVNAVQYELVRSLTETGRGLFVIGDPDQAIYGFRGADPGFFRRLGDDYAETTVHHLWRNYRSQPGIVEAASAVIGAGRGDAAGARTPTAARPGAAEPLQLLAADGETAEGIAVARAVASLVGGADMIGADAHSGDGDAWSFGDIAVLTRTARQADILEACFHKEGLPYRVVGQKGFLQERGARDAVAFFRYALDPSRPLRLIEALRNGPFHIGAQALAQLSAAAGSTTHLDEAIATLPTTAAAQVEGLRRAAAGYARRAERDPPAEVLRVWQKELDMEATPAFERLVGVAEGSDSLGDLLDLLLLGHEADVERRGTVQTPGRPAAEAVTLMTMHASKGLEFPVVFICGVEDGLLPLRRADGSQDREEERRLFYVALTRAQEHVVLTHARQRTIRGTRQAMTPSPFLADIPAHLLDERRVAPARRRGGQLSLFPS